MRFTFYSVVAAAGLHAVEAIVYERPEEQQLVQMDAEYDLGD